MATYLVPTCSPVDGARGLLTEGGSQRGTVIERVLKGVDGKQKIFRPGSWPGLPSVGVTGILLLGLGLGGCAERPSPSGLLGWTQNGRTSAEAEQDMSQCRRGAVVPALINSKGLVVRQAMVSEERLADC